MVIALELVRRREDVVLWHPDELAQKRRWASEKQQEESKAKVKGAIGPRPFGGSAEQ